MPRLARMLALLAFAAAWPLGAGAADVTVQYDITGGQASCTRTFPGGGSCSFLGGAAVQSGTVTVTIQPAGSGGPPLSTSQGSILFDLRMTNGSSFVRTLPYVLLTTPFSSANLSYFTRFTRGPAKTLRATAHRTFTLNGNGSAVDGFDARLLASSQGVLSAASFRSYFFTGTLFAGTFETRAIVDLTGAEVAAVPEPGSTGLLAAAAGLTGLGALGARLRRRRAGRG